MLQTRWSDGFLDPMRREGDPHTDLIVREIFERGQIQEVNRLFRTLVSNEQPPPEQLPPSVRSFLGETPRLPEWADRAAILRAQRLFGRHAPLIVLILFCGSLPVTYLAREGVQVIYRTARLVRDPRRRAVETAQLVIDAMSPGGMDPLGRGIRTAQKVRLIHSGIRHILLEGPKQHVAELEPWDPQLGMPINQEDLAGTLLTFAVSVTVGLGYLGVDLEHQECEDYLHAWKVVAHFLGLREELMPRDYEDALALARSVERRHFAASPEGQQLTDALLKLLNDAVPGEILDGVPASLIRRLLGDARAGLLKVPDPDWTRLLLRAAKPLVKSADELMDHSGAFRRVGERFGQGLIEFLLTLERGPKGVRLRIPTALRERVAPRHEVPAAPFVARAVRSLVELLPKPRLVTRSFALQAPYDWLQFATRFKDDDGVVGERFFEEFAKRIDAHFQGRGTDTGLMERFEDLRSEDFEPFAVAEIIREFYERTTRFDLDLQVHWEPLFYPILWAYREWLARRMRNLHIPSGTVRDLDSWIDLLDVDRDGKPDVRAWVRVQGSDRIPIYVGAYKIYASVVDGARRSYVTVAFPILGGNLATVLAPKNLEGGGLGLTTRDANSSECGLYHVIPSENSFAMWPAYGLQEEFELHPAADGTRIDVEHVCRFLGLKAFTMRYRIERKRPRAADPAREFRGALRRSRRPAPRPAPAPPPA